MVHCDGGYSSNLPVADLIAGKAMVATHFDGLPLSPTHGGPARLLVPHLYFWKSAKWIRRIVFHEHDSPGFWESLRSEEHTSELQSLMRNSNAVFFLKKKNDI